MKAQAYSAMVQKLFKATGFNEQSAPLLHAAVGVAGEAGEILDCVKKVWANGKLLDLDHLVEELGDIEFYLEAVRQAVGVSRDEVLSSNQIKLVKRYPDLRYSDSLAQLRLDKESTVGRDLLQS